MSEQKLSDVWMAQVPISVDSITVSIVVGEVMVADSEWSIERIRASANVWWQSDRNRRKFPTLYRYYLSKLAYDKKPKLRYDTRISGAGYA